jgi:hypothetical protein
MDVIMRAKNMLFKCYEQDPYWVCSCQQKRAEIWVALGTWHSNFICHDVGLANLVQGALVVKVQMWSEIYSSYFIIQSLSMQNCSSLVHGWRLSWSCVRVRMIQWWMNLANLKTIILHVKISAITFRRWPHCSLQTLSKSPKSCQPLSTFHHPTPSLSCCNIFID